MFYTDPLTMYQLISEAYGDYLIEHHSHLAVGLPIYGIYQQRYDFVMASDLLQIGAYIKELHAS